MSKKEKEIILFGRLGNKENDIKFFEKYLPFDCVNVVEPFGGSFAVIRRKYNDDKYTKYVNDLDTELKKIYDKPEEFAQYKHELNEIAKNNLDEKKNVNFKKWCEIIKEKEYDKSDFFKIYADGQIVKGFLIKQIKDNFLTKVKPTVDLMKKINFTFVDWYDCILKHHKNKDTFIFLDPPYLFSNNETYTPQNDNLDMTDILYKIIEIFQNKETKAKIMLVINDLKILRWLYRDYLKCDYVRIYQLSKKQMKHLVICNY